MAEGTILDIAAQQGQFNTTAPEPSTSVLEEAPNIVDDYTKGLFASTETSEDTSGDWLQLEHNTFVDLKKRGKIDFDVEWGEVKVNKSTYDKVARVYIDDIMKTFGIPTVEEAALWSWRPAYYRRYGGDINKIPDSIKGVAWKSAKQVMMDRSNNLNYFMERYNATSK